jgi:hypothetical protein
MPKIVRMTPGCLRRPDFEVSLAFRGDLPVGAIEPHKDVANEIAIAFGTRNDGSIEAIKDLPILQPSIDQKLERSRIVNVIDGIFCRSNANVIPRGYSYSNPNARHSLHTSNPLLWSARDLRLHKNCDRRRESPLVASTHEPRLPGNKTRWRVKRILAQVGNTRQECDRNRLVEEKTALICHPCSHRQHCLARYAVVINAHIVCPNTESQSSEPMKYV